MKNGILNEIRLGPDSDTWRRIDTLLYLPTDYDPAKKYPLICFWHGVGEGGPNLSKLYNQGLPAVYQKHINAGDIASTDLDKFIFMAIQGASNWPPSAAVFVGGINYLSTIISIDRSRIYATGLSAGGQGSRSAIESNPETFAACVSMSPASGTPDSAVDSYANRYIWFFQGIYDTTVSPANAYNSVAKINAKYPGHALLTTYPNGHNSWNNYYEPSWKWTKNETDKDVNGPNELSLYDWMLQYSTEQAESPKPPVTDPVQPPTEEPSSDFVQGNAIITGSTKDGGTGIINITLPTNSVELDAGKSTGSIDKWRWGVQGDSPNKQATISGQGTSKATFSNLKEGTYSLYVTGSSSTGKGWPTSCLMTVNVKAAGEQPDQPAEPELKFTLVSQVKTDNGYTVTLKDQNGKEYQVTI